MEGVISNNVFCIIIWGHKELRTQESNLIYWRGGGVHSPHHENPIKQCHNYGRISLMNIMMTFKYRDGPSRETSSNLLSKKRQGSDRKLCKHLAEQAVLNLQHSKPERVFSEPSEYKGEASKGGYFWSVHAGIYFHRKCTRSKQINCTNELH